MPVYRTPSNDTHQECRACKEWKVWEDFNKNSWRKQGKGTICKVCDRKQASDRAARDYAENPSLFRAKRSMISIKSTSKQRGFELDPRLTVKYLEKLFEEAHTCPACGETYEPRNKVVSGFNPQNLKSKSLDRFDSSVGYTVENVNVMCSRCNCLKGEASLKEIEGIYKFMLRKSKNKPVPTQ